MSQGPLDLLRKHLLQQVDHGVTHVRLSENARAALWPSKAASKPRPALSPPVSTATPSAPRGANAAPPEPREAPARTATPLPASPQAQPSSSPDAGLSREERLQKLREEAASSELCKALGSLRDTMVFAVGSPHAEIMFIGEAPGAEEEKQREPFVGPAGQLLTKIIQAMGLKRSDVYISNICKYRPVIADDRPQGARNRPPSAGEMQSCLPYILEEIAVIQPKVIVALGSTASSGLGLEGSVGRLRGSFRDFHGTPVMVTYHPSYLLRCEDKDGGGIKEKRLVWEDILRVMEHTGLPVSEKQRAYFTKARG